MLIARWNEASRTLPVLTYLNRWPTDWFGWNFRFVLTKMKLFGLFVLFLKFTVWKF